jgi:chemotaxis signal transduction protein
MTTTTASPALERVLCLLFRAGGERFAVRASDVQKVTPPGHLSKLPCLPPPLLGITQHRGRVLTVVDGVALLANGSATASVDSRLLILEKPVRHLGLLVDGVDEIESLRLPADVSSLQRGTHGALRVAQHRGRALPLVDVAALVELTNALL